MSTSVKEAFGKWLQKQLESKDWRPADLCRHTGLPDSTISRTLRGITLPTPVSLQVFAQALNIPVEEVYRQAGYIKNSLTASESELLQIYRILPEDRRQILSRLMRIMAE